MCQFKLSHRVPATFCSRLFAERPLLLSVAATPMQRHVIKMNSSDASVFYMLATYVLQVYSIMHLTLGIRYYFDFQN